VSGELISVKVVGVSETIAKLKLTQEAIDQAVMLATTAIELDASSVMMEQIVGGHAYGTPRSSSPTVVEGKPSSVTGALKNSIVPSSFTKQIGFGEYQAVVGPGVVYARSLELGNPRWTSGVKYPFVAPTATIMGEGNRVRNVYKTALMKALRV